MGDLIWFILAGAGITGTIALIWFAPGVLAVWSALPRTLRWAVAATGALLATFLYGRKKGGDRERDRQQALIQAARAARAEVDRRVGNMKPAEVDSELERKGDFRD